jgi:multidrug efflux pump subunit AcrB
VLDPRPDIFVPFYFIGSVTGLIGAYMRQAAWVVVLTAWFSMMNIIALYQLFVL